MLADPIIYRWTDVAAGWLLTYLIHSTLILLATWVVTSQRGLRDATREILWKAALVGGVVTATVQSATAREPLGGQIRLATGIRPGAAQSVRFDVRVDHAGPERRLLVRRQEGAWWSTGLVAFWLTGAGVGLLWLTAAYARMTRDMGDRTPLAGTPIAHRMRGLLAHAGVVGDIELTCSAAIASPVALAGREVCLPRRALLELEPIEQDSMLAHEVAHVVRRDPHWLIAARAIEIVLFVQPLNRLARRRLQDVAEFLCDDWAVQRTSHPVTLAKCLAAVAEWVGRAPRLHPVSAMVESGGSALVHRVGRILGDRAAVDAPSSRDAVARCAGACVCALLALAAVAPRVSVARAVLSDRTVTFVREIIERDGPVASGARDTMVVFRARGAHVEFASTVEERGGVMWTRPLSAPPTAGAVTASGAPRARLILVERRVEPR